MICRPKNGLVIADDCSNVFLFYQCINEMVFDFTPDSYKAKTLNVHSLCRELLATYGALCQTGTEEKYYKKYIAIIIDELIKCIKEDVPAKEIIGGRYDRIITILDESKTNAKIFESTIRNLMGYFGNEKYYNSVKDNLIKCICGEKNQKNIIKLSETWITELLTLGYSKQHIYNVISDFFSNRVINNKAIILEFFDLFDFVHKKWEFLIPVDERIMTYLGNLSKINDINDIAMVKMGIDELNELIQKRDYRSLTGFLNEIQLLEKLYNVKILKCTCESLDPYTGMSYLQGYLKFLTNIIVTVDNETKRIYSTCVCLNYNKTNIRIKAAMHRRNRVYSQSYLPNVIKLLKTMNVSDETYGLLMKVFRYHGDVITSGVDNKYALTMLWTALETLFVNDSHNVNKGETVKTALIEILQRTYITKRLKYLHADFVANVKATNKELVETYDLESFPKFVEIMINTDDKDTISKLEKTLEKNPLLRTRIFCLIEQDLKNGGSIERLLERHKEKLLQQIDRIYRNRNFLIHAGQEFWYEDEIVECLHNYLDFVINYIIVKMEAGEGIVDIYDIIEEARLDNQIHHSILREKKNESTTIENYKELLFGPSDNILQYYVNHDV